MERLVCGGGYICPPHPQIANLLTNDPASALEIIVILCDDNNCDNKHGDKD